MYGYEEPNETYMAMKARGATKEEMSAFYFEKGDTCDKGCGAVFVRSMYKEKHYAKKHFNKTDEEVTHERLEWINKRDKRRNASTNQTEKKKTYLEKLCREGRNLTTSEKADAIAFGITILQIPKVTKRKTLEKPNKKTTHCSTHKQEWDEWSHCWDVASGWGGNPMCWDTDN